MSAAETDRVCAVVADVVEQVFGTVARLQPTARRVLEGDDDAQAELAGTARALLREPGQFAVGLGAIAAPRSADGDGLRLIWWQVDPAAGRPVRLDPDLRSSSLGFYDYTATGWYDVPRRTGRRHVVGPYVDVHGTGRYLLTLTGPVLADDGAFLGVVGADVPVPRFESHVLQALAAVPRPFVLLNDEDRVVLSTSAGWLVGDLVRTTSGLSPAATPVAGVPWRVHLAQGDARPLPA